MVAHPPCTRLANSGVRWLQSPPPGKTVEQMHEALLEGAAFYRMLRDADVPRKAIENPIMHKHAKLLIGLPDLVPTNRLSPPAPGSEEHKQWSECHRASPGPDRWKNRSRTYQGIADAMAAQWSKS